MAKNSLLSKTPVLFLIFNRPDTTKRVFAEIRKAKPKQLFIASDGPRENKLGEKEIVEKVRSYVLDNIDWPCKVKTLFRKENLGCKYAVSGAIDWFFKNVEQGIILEDDCLPDQSFFRFCEEMLERYKNEEEVMMISGDNFIEKYTKNLIESYYFSKNAHIWGWASWARAWKNYDVELNKQRVEKIVSNSSLNFLERKILLKRLKDIRQNKVNTWDYQWQFTILENNGLCIIPKINLVENVGLLQDKFTNAKPNNVDLKYLYLKRGKLYFPLLSSEKRYRKDLDRKDNLLNLKRIIKKKIWKN